MANYSKQWCEEFGDGKIRGSFDIKEEYSRLQPEHYFPFTCNGYGFIAIGNMEGECKLAMPVGDSVEWVEYDKIVMV